MTETIGPWIAQICKERREEAGLTLAQVAQVARRNISNVSRFEQAQGIRESAHYVQAYADALGLSSTRPLWADAVARWEGTAPPTIARPNMNGHGPTPLIRVTQHSSVVGAIDQLAKELSRLRYSEMALLDAIFGYTQTPMAVIEAPDTYVRVNQAMGQLYKVTPEELAGRTVSELLPDFAPTLISRIEKVLTSGEAEQFEAAVTIYGVERYWVTQYVPIELEGHNTSHVLVMASDVSERRELERVLGRLIQSDSPI